MRKLTSILMLVLLVLAQFGAMAVIPCAAHAAATAHPGTTTAPEVSGGYTKPDGTRTVIPKFKGAMKGGKPVTYKQHHPKHPKFAAPLMRPVSR